MHSLCRHRRSFRTWLFVSCIWKKKLTFSFTWHLHFCKKWSYDHQVKSEKWRNCKWKTLYTLGAAQLPPRTRRVGYGRVASSYKWKTVAPTTHPITVWGERGWTRTWFAHKPKHEGLNERRFKNEVVVCVGWRFPQKKTWYLKSLKDRTKALGTRQPENNNINGGHFVWVYRFFFFWPCLQGTKKINKCKRSNFFEHIQKII